MRSAAKHSLLQPVQPFTQPCELRLKFLFYIRRHSSRPKKVPEHVGIALLRSGNGPFGVFPVAHVKLAFDNGGERQAYAQVRPDEINDCLVDFVPDSQRFVEHVAHISTNFHFGFGSWSVYAQPPSFAPPTWSSCPSCRFCASWSRLGPCQAPLSPSHKTSKQTSPIFLVSSTCIPPSLASFSFDFATKRPPSTPSPPVLRSLPSRLFDWGNADEPGRLTAEWSRRADRRAHNVVTARGSFGNVRHQN